MLEALVSVRHNGEKEMKKRGDILVVKLAGSPWSSMERQFHQLVEWEDAELEQKLEAERELEPCPIAVHPYAEYRDEPVLDDKGNAVTDSESGEPLMQSNMVSRSTEQVDLDALPMEIKARVMDVNVERPRLKITEYQRRRGAVSA